MQDSIFYIYSTIITSTIFILILFTVLFIALNKSYNERLKQTEKEKLISAVYEQKLSESEIIAQETTLNYVGKELHDKIGLTLTLAKLNLNTTLINLSDEISEKFQNVENTLTDAIAELKEISTSMNSDIANEFGLIHAIETEIKRINRTSDIRIAYEINGSPLVFKNEETIAIIRVIQELLNNLLKHSKSTNICIQLDYFEQYLIVSIIDNGIPIDYLKNQRKSSGLINIKHRLSLLKSELIYRREQNKNTAFFKIIMNQNEGNSNSNC